MLLRTTLRLSKTVKNLHLINYLILKQGRKFSINMNRLYMIPKNLKLQKKYFGNALTEYPIQCKS
ncbi:hypothetical protein D0Z68_01505 [Rickettsia japonica]|uniref:Palindromic element RPE4 domain-containing protein n=1 Tax=Rickettsia japonica TaxID=35790 RepID=A0ABM6YHG7_RICJA|nr:hypothetical protein D0Z68_01505 [Rickettsia japonica]